MYSTVINRGTWDRLKKQALPQKENVWKKSMLSVRSQECKDKRIEKLQEVTINDIEVQRQKQLSEIEKYKQTEQEATKKQKAINKKVIREAKDLIYSRSCYGQALKSAYLQSKALEEVDAQIEFKKQVNAEWKAHDEAERKKLQAMLEEKYKLQDDEVKFRKDRDKEYSEIYKAIITMNKQNAMEQKRKEVEAEKEDFKILAEWVKRDKEIWNQRKMFNKEQLMEYEELKRIYRSTKKEIAEADSKLMEVWRQYQDRNKIKQKEIADQMHMHNTKRSNDHFALIDKMYEKEQKKYEEFIAKGVDKFQKTLVDRFQKNTTEREQTERARQNIKNIAVAKENLEMAENKMPKEHEWVDGSKCVCLRQSLFTKPRPNPQKNPKEMLVLFESYGCPTQSSSFTSPSTALIHQLKLKQKEPSPWSGTQAEHKTFALKATETLTDCKYKNMAKKVIDDYRQNNNLDAKSLPVEGY